MDLENYGKSLTLLVKALCADYPRRARIIAKNGSDRRSRRLAMECAYFNRRIFEAVSEITGADLAEIFIREIGEGTGYAKSEVTVLSESVYKEYKREARAAIAKKLHLL